MEKLVTQMNSMAVSAKLWA